MTKAQSRKPVSLFMLFLKMGGWIVAIAGLVLLVLSIASSQSLKLAERFDDEGRAAMAIDFVAVEASAADPLGEVGRLLAFFGIDASEFDPARARLPAPMASTGAPAWRAGFSEPQIAEASALIPDDLARDFGWRK